jgi:hypothetical protein
LVNSEELPDFAVFLRFLPGFADLFRGLVCYRRTLHQIVVDIAVQTPQIRFVAGYQFDAYRF